MCLGAHGRAGPTTALTYRSASKAPLDYTELRSKPIR